MIGIPESLDLLFVIMSVLSHFRSEGWWLPQSLCRFWIRDPPQHSVVKVERQWRNSAEQSWQWVMGQTGHSDGSSVGARDPLTRLYHRHVDALVLIRNIVRLEFIIKTSTVSSGMSRKTPLHWVVGGSSVGHGSIVYCLKGQVFRRVSIV